MNRLSIFDHVSFLTNSLDSYVGKSIELYGEWSHGEIDAITALVKSGQNILEVGSNIGAHTVFLARHAGNSGSVYAFEPRRILFQTLCANIALNGLTNVHARQLALGSHAETIMEAPFIFNNSTNFGAFSLGEVIGNGELIDIVAIDSLIDSIKSISLLKADVEGYEFDVLTGAELLIKRDRPCLYLENDRLDKSAQLIKKCFDLNYDLFWHIVPLFRVNNFTKTTINIFGNIASFNMIGVPKEKEFVIEGLPKIKDIEEHPLKKIV